MPEHVTGHLDASYDSGVTRDLLAAAITAVLLA